MVEWLVELRKRQAATAVRAGESMPDSQSPVFSIGRNHLKTLRKDALFAGLGETDEQGNVTGSHSFRKGTCRMLALSGVPMAITIKIVRHQDAKLTMNTYAEIEGLRDGAKALQEVAGGPLPQALPNEGPQDVTARHHASLAATGTDAVSTTQGSEGASVASPNVAAGHHTSPTDVSVEMVGRTGLEPVTSTM